MAIDALQWSELLVGVLVGSLAVAIAVVSTSRFALIGAWAILTLLAIEWQRGLTDIVSDRSWPLVAFIPLALLLSIGTLDVVARYGTPVVLTLLVITAGGVYVNVPDTEVVAIVAAGLGVIAAAAWLLDAGDGLVAGRLPKRAIRIATDSVAFAPAVLLLAGADGARGRPLSFVGVVAAFGVLVAIVPVSLVRKRSRLPLPVMAIVHIAIVGVVSRVPIGRSASESAVVAALALGVGAAILVLAALATSRRDS